MLKLKRINGVTPKSDVQLMNLYQCSKKKTVLKFKNIAFETVLIRDSPYYPPTSY